MSDELERRLREVGHRLPAPDPAATHTARARFLDAAFRRRRPVRRRTLALSFALAVVVAGAFGVGYAVAAGGGTKTVTTTKVVRVKERLQAGPGFLPADGWSTSVVVDPTSGSVREATVTNANGTRIVARFAPASERPAAAQKLLPLRLPAGGRVRTLLAHVSAYAVGVTVTFRSAPTPASEAAAREELGRLVVPSCPAALPLPRGGSRLTKRARIAAETAAAEAYVLGWLPAHYSGKASEVEGATGRAALGAKMPRYGEAVHDCGARVASRSVEVDVTLPRLAKISASLSELTYFVARTRQGWTVWERVR
jgi:hypothetical protein